ncbi:pimeloyl-ACP methyl ester carboxylesterase [Marmoricola sp. OAE513]|uniref:alpha/beta fold hydrolase n=1 Tax=Marmoricola sp. OAE513 TaxID=2817894 RepID=UPI001AE519B9
MGRSGVVVSRPLLARWQTRALEVGPHSAAPGPVLVLLHGFGDHAGTWLPVLEQLDEAGCRAVALDMPGYGEADPLEPGESLPQLDAFLAAAVERWTIDGIPPVVVGNSLGGVVAIRAGQDPRSVVSGIVPVAPAGFSHSWILDLLENNPWLQPLMTVPVPTRVFRLLTIVGYNFIAGGTAKVLPGVAAAVADVNFPSRAHVSRVLGNAVELLGELRMISRDHVGVPVLVLWGRHDKLTLVEGAEAVRGLAPGAEVVVLEDCGHCPQVSRPDLVAAHLISFSGALVSTVAG